MRILTSIWMVVIVAVILLGIRIFFFEPSLNIIKTVNALKTINKLALVNDKSISPNLISGPNL